MRRTADSAKDQVVGCTYQENESLSDLFIDAYIGLLSSSPFDVQKPAHLKARFRRRLVSSLRSTISTFSSYADAILQSCNFASEDTKTGAFLEEMKDTPVFREYLIFFRTGNAEVLQYLLSFLYYGKKLDLDYPDLEQVAFRDWLDVEEEMRKLTFDKSELAVLETVISCLVDPVKFDDTILLPKNGSGSVSEKIRTKAEKFKFLAADVKLATAFRSSRFARFSQERSSGSLSYYAQQRADLFGVLDTEAKRSRLAFVPKSYKAYRTICMEPAAYMFFQQEVMRWLVSCMRESKIYDFCSIDDQSKNQEFAIEGSVHKSLDTIDLSAASDRVHTDLVRAVFPRKILYYLLGTRSSSVMTIDGQHRRLNKFAPMGSALCFPVQCIIFSGITVIGYLMKHHSCTLEDLALLGRDDLRRLVKQTLESLQMDPSIYGRRLFAFRVYGDDIVCDSRVTANVTHLLQHFGFKVNDTKSFIGGQSVRESCGIYAYEGTDITPLLFRIKRSERKLSASAYSSWVSSINRTGDYGFKPLHSILIRSLRHRLKSDYGKDSVPFTTDRNVFGIWTKSLRPTSNLVRNNLDWQVEEEKVLIVRDVEHVDLSRHQTYFYDQWMRSKLRDSLKPDLTPGLSQKLPRYARIVWGWTPRRA